MTQLGLPLKLADHAVFASFLPDGNEPAVNALQNLDAGGGGCWLWGPTSSGKTHLLQAACECAGDAAAYLPLSTLADTAPAVLDGMDSRRLVCLDDLDAVAGRDDWELSLFALYNGLADSGGALVVATTAPPRAAGVRLDDLASRLRSLPVFQLHSLSEARQVRALQLRSRFRGLDLPGEVAEFLLRRSRRDMASLYALLDDLDRAALAAQRRLTIPFAREVLASR